MKCWGPILALFGEIVSSSVASGIHMDENLCCAHKFVSVLCKLFYLLSLTNISRSICDSNIANGQLSLIGILDCKNSVSIFLKQSVFGLLTCVSQGNLVNYNLMLPKSSGYGIDVSLCSFFPSPKVLYYSCHIIHRLYFLQMVTWGLSEIFAQNIIFWWLLMRYKLA